VTASDAVVDGWTSERCDLGGDASTDEFADSVAERVREMG